MKIIFQLYVMSVECNLENLNLKNAQGNMHFLHICLIDWIVVETNTTCVVSDERLVSVPIFRI